MRRLFLGLVLLTGLTIGLTATASAWWGDDVYVQGYVRRDGIYVAPHYRTRPNDTVYDNYSYWGNYNPYTGRYGTRRSPETTSWNTWGSFGWSGSESRSRQSLTDRWSWSTWGAESRWSSTSLYRESGWRSSWWR